jgi:hypothetical protein
MDQPETHSANTGCYNIEHETAASRAMLEKRIPTRLDNIYRVLRENTQQFEPWRVTVMVHLVQDVERNCNELLETFGKDRLPAVWIARNLLELWVWVKYCGVSRDAAWRFHEDALRDVKGMVLMHRQACEARGLETPFFSSSIQKIDHIAAEKLGVANLDADFLGVGAAAKTPGVDLGPQFNSSNRTLSKFAHPTAGLIHGIMHQEKICRELQACYTTFGVFYAAQSTLAAQAQLGVADSEG